MLDFSLLRKNMVESQVRTNDVTDRRVLRAMLETRRERFVPDGLQTLAYSGEGLPLGNGRHLLAPAVAAKLLQLADISPGDTVLEIGCATGYATALIAKLAHSVTGLESDPRLADLARANLTAVGASNASVKVGALIEGEADGGPFDVIIVSGSLPEVPPAWRALLRDGGRLAAVLADGPLGRATLLEPAADGFSRRYAFDAAVPMLPGFERKPVFAL